MGGTGTGDTVPAHTMLLECWPQAPRRPQPAVDASAYFPLVTQPSWRAADSPSMRVLLRPSRISKAAVLRLSASTPLKVGLPVAVDGAVMPSAVQTAAMLFDRLTAM